jgi:hypothetical protein
VKPRNGSRAISHGDDWASRNWLRTRQLMLRNEAEVRSRADG